MKTGLLALILGVPLVLGGAEAPPRPSITGIQIRLFCDGTGELTPDVASMPDLRRWDPTTGGGGAPCASSATMLVWVLRGEPGTYLGQWRLNYHATREKRGSGRRSEIGEGAIRLGTADGEGRLYVPLLLHDTECDVVRVGAMVGEAPPASQWILPFRCEG